MINHGLLFAGLLPPPLGGSEGQNEQNLVGSGPGNGLNVGVGMGGPAVTMEMACR